MINYSTYVIKNPTYSQAIDNYNYIVLFISYMDQITRYFKRSFIYLFDY